MKVYYIWILLNIISWLFAVGGFAADVEHEFWQLFSLSGYFIVFFILPLFSDRHKLLALLLSMNAVLAVITVYPVDAIHLAYLITSANQEAGFNPFILLVFALLTAEIVYRLPMKFIALPFLVQSAGIFLLASISGLSVYSNLFIAMFMILLFSGAVYYKLTKEREFSASARYDALLMEYRALKRRLGTEEEAARQEERALIGHEIHDSVGHKLTALLMQLEALRLKAVGEDRKQAELLKKLAHDSLEETRRAVKTFKHGETGGLQGIMRLIRKLETGSFLRTHFTVNHGAFSVPLSGEQSFVVYRSVQEALTNIMKHSKAREANVNFEAPGGSLFRFEISNPVPEKYTFQEGFGLTSMRERLQKIGGDLEVFKEFDKFVVRGWIRIV